MEKIYFLISLLLFSYSSMAAICRGMIDGPNGGGRLPNKFCQIRIYSSGTYTLPKVTQGNIVFDLDQHDQVVIEGVSGGSILRGRKMHNSSDLRHVSHIRGRIPKNASVVLRNIEIIGDEQNAVSLEGQEGEGPVTGYHRGKACMFNRTYNLRDLSSGIRRFHNFKITNHDRQQGGKRIHGTGCVNPGPNSVVTGNRPWNCGDDGVKLTEAYSFSQGLNIKVHGNGSPIQLGWACRGDGPFHIAKNINVSGFLSANNRSKDNYRHPIDGNTPGRSVVGGQFFNDASNIIIRNLPIQGNKYAHLLKIVAEKKAVVKNIFIEFNLKAPLKNAGPNHTALVFARYGNAKIQNVCLDMGSNRLNQLAKQKHLKVIGMNKNKIKFVNNINECIRQFIPNECNELANHPMASQGLSCF